MPRTDDGCEVLVVGAGPTGLMAANLLKRSGVDVRIVERRLEASRESRAFAVQARTLELMQQIGLSETFLEQGVIATGVDIHVRGKRRGGLDLDRARAPDTPFQFIFMIPQSKTERILLDDLAALGVEVERGVEVQSIEETADGITATVEQDGTTRTIRARYVVGADGSRSKVREEAGLQFTGGMFPQNFLLADCKVEWPLDHQRFRVFVNGPMIGLFLPLDGENVSRVMTNDTTPDGGKVAGGDASQRADVDIAEMQRAFRIATGVDATLSDPVWITNYRAHHRAVDAYRAGRTFVAGDAAHIHSPAGGQGMNTGLQDVANLAWKLSLALRGYGDDALLDDYGDEREPIGELVVKSSGKLFDAAVSKAGWRSSLRDWLAMSLLPVVSTLPPFHIKGFFNTSQRAIGYPTSRFVADGPAWLKKGPKAGERAPNARINKGTEVFDVLAGYDFKLVAFSHRPIGSAEIEAIRAKLDALASRLPNCRTEVIARTPRGPEGDALFVTDGAAFTAYGLTAREGQDQGIYLIRPDNYVAFRSAGLDTEPCALFLDEFLGDAAGTPSPSLAVKADRDVVAADG